MKLFIHWIFIAALFIHPPKLVAQKLAAIPYVTGIGSPIDIKNCGDDRLFVADRTGIIYVVNGDGSLRTIPFLSIPSKISSVNSEEGFLGIVFSPNYKESGKFYVDYTSIIGGRLTTVVEEYKVSAADSNVADVASRITLFTQLQPFSNHNGGNLMFGKDGYLYVNLGDGGSGGDPYGNGQNKKTFLGKILRVDVSNSSTAQPYVIPSSNPFYNDTTAGIKKEIWAYGVRNPWRSSVDRLTGDLWIADVGQGAHEEIDYQPVNDPGGRNYGWNIMEGNFCYSPPAGCNTSGLTLPVYDYSHALGFAVTGGYVYRSAQSKTLFGMYIFADYGSRWIDGIRQSGGILSGEVTHLITAAQATGNPISFGEDRYGDQYVVYIGNTTVYKLMDTNSLRHPKAYVTSTPQGAGTFLLQALQGKDITYQWLKEGVPVAGATSPGYITSGPGRYRLEVTNALNFKDTSEVLLLGSSIDLTSFTAQKIPEGVGLQWATLQEQNISGFAIQRRKNSELVFSNIGFVNSKAPGGFSDLELDYIFKDSTAFNYSKLFYRLEIRHTDGSVTYSATRVIDPGSIKNDFTLFPNPATREAQIYLYEFTLPLTMIIYDNTGKKVQEKIIAQQNISISVPASKGIYILQLSNNDGSNKVRKKLLVQ